MSAIIGFLGGMGDAGVKMGMQHLKSMDEDERDEKLQRMRDESEQKKELRLQAIKNAPYDRLKELATAASKEQVPLEAAPVTNLTGAGLTTTDTKAPRGEDGKPRSAGSSFKGDPEEVLAGIMALPDSVERREALVQFESQKQGDRKANNAAIIGKMRDRTPDEALKEAAERAKIADPEAAAVYEEKFGKPKRDERRLDQVDARDAAREKKDDARQAAYDKKIDSDTAYNQRREERLDKLQEIQLERMKAQGDKAETQSQRSAAVELMKSTEREAERVMTLAKDPTLSPDMQKMFEARGTRLTKDLGHYRQMVESFAGDSAARTEPEQPKPRNGWNSTTGEVYDKDGQMIGKAKDAGAARLMIEKPPAAKTSTAIIGRDDAPAQPAPEGSARSVYEKSGRAAKDQEDDKATAARDQAKAKAEADEDVIALRRKLADAKRSGDPREAPKITGQIQDLLKTRYGI